MFREKEKQIIILVREHSALILGITALLAINVLWLVPTLRSIRQTASTLVLESAERIGSNIESTMQRSSDALIGAADDIGILPEQYAFILKRLLSKEDGLQSVSIIAVDGRQTFRLDRVATVSQEESFVFSSAAQIGIDRALAGEASIGEIFLSDILEPRTILAAPIRTIGKIQGVLVGELNLRPLISFLRDASLPAGHMYVVDRDGFQILHPELPEFLRHPNYISRPIVKRVIGERHVADGRARDDTYVNEAGVRVFAVGIPLAIGGWSIFAEQPRIIALSREWEMLLLALGISVFGSLAIIIISVKHRSLSGSNSKLKEMLADLDISGKMLVRRDLQLTRANARLMELDQMKSQFVSTAAHQLRTPLTALEWSLNELLEGDFGELKKNQKKLVEDIVIANKRLIRLVNSLLDVARLEEGKRGMSMQKQDIVSVVQGVGDQFKKIAKEKRIGFSFESSAKSLLVDFDKEKLNIALTNLVDNAVKYTPAGGAINLSVAGMEKEVCIAVTDTGIGIPEEQANKIFSKFFRARNAMLLETYGSGLGLSVAKDIVERHQGTIAFTSNVGGGSIFTITLPRA